MEIKILLGIIVDRLSFILLPFCLGVKKYFLRIYSFLAIHILTASSTARVKSPFLPPSFSTVFSLSCFSRSSGRYVLILPILNRLTFLFIARFHVSNILPISELQNVYFCIYFNYHYLFTLIRLSL